MAAPVELLGWSARLCCVGIFLQAAELLAVSSEMRETRLLGWQGGGAAPPRGLVGRFLRRTQTFGWRRGAMVVRLIAALVVLVLPFGGSGAAWAVLTGLFLTQLFFNRRFRVVLANSDYLNLCCLAALAIAARPGSSPAMVHVAAGFMAFQACFGYVASGVDKLAGANWRNGDRLTDIFQNSSHRVPWLGRWLAAHRSAAAALSFGVIALEVLFPLCLVLPPAGFWIFIGAGALFHASIAVLMALPGFFWAFAATYPAMYVVREWLASP